MVENLGFKETVAHKEAVYGEFEKYVRDIFQTDHGSPQRLALNDWYALQEIRTVHDMLQTAIEADKAFGTAQDPALPDEFEESIAQMQQVRSEMNARTKRYLMHLITDQRTAGSPKESLYNQTILHLNEKIHPKLLRFEEARIVALDRGGYFTPGETAAMAMKRVVTEVKIRIGNGGPKPFQKTA
jgi:hypothetical protein